MQEVLDLLSKLGIEYKNYEHQAVYTCEESKNVDDDIVGARSKNLFIKGRTSGKYYLVILDCSKRADLKKITEILGEKKISFASPEEMSKYLKLTPGSVSPFGLINDINHQVTVLIDQELWNNKFLTFHPNMNTATVSIAKVEFERFLRSAGAEFKIENI